MDDIPVYYDSDEDVYHIIEEDVYLGGLPFSSYSLSFEGSDATTQTCNQMKAKKTQYAFTEFDTIDDDDDDDDDDDCYEYVYGDDEDYIPKTGSSRKSSKSKARPYGIYPTIDQTAMDSSRRTKTYSCGSDKSSGKKDHTPRTILKMMERHRENERVRHHSLNESMRDICEKVPGYDPSAKETKVIQMQRIISYECYLENTLLKLCKELSIKPKSLNMNTMFITEQIKDKKPGSWSHIPFTTGYNAEKLAAEDFDETPEAVNNLRRREKISSPTIDSTTDTCHTVPVSQWGLSQGTESSQDSSRPTQSFIPIDVAEITCEHNDSEAVVPVYHDIPSFFDPDICSESENLKTITATFMNEDLVPTSTSIEDNSTGFDLSSPIRSNKVFLQSPKTKSWHEPASGYLDSPANLNESSELTSVSPEFILETKPKFSLSNIQNKSDRQVPLHSYSSTEAKLIKEGFQPYKTENTDDAELFKNGFRVYKVETTANCGEPGKTKNRRRRLIIVPRCNFNKESNMTKEDSQKPVPDTVEAKAASLGKGPWDIHDSSNIVFKSKRKKSPKRSPFSNITNWLANSASEVLVSKEATYSPPHKKAKKTSSDTFSKKESNPIYNVETAGGYQEVFSSGNISPESCSEDSWDQSKIDHRRTTWMNGFMMFSQLNRRKFIGANPGVHTSHISKMMGHVWRNMSSDEQKPYREKAKTYTNYIKSAYVDFNTSDFLDSLVPSSTTDIEESYMYSTYSQ